MRKVLSTIIAIAIASSCGASVLFTCDMAQAQSKPAAKANKGKPALNSVLGALKWGMSSEKAKKIIADKIMADYNAKAEGNADLSYIDHLRKTHSDRVENMQKSYLTLTRDNSAALSVSIVGEEFMPDAGESMLTSREDNATKYYFFQNDKLYKVAVVYDSSYLGPVAFDTFCATTAQKYGKAAKEIWDDDGNFLASVWTDNSNVKLTVKNKFSSYNTVLMVFADDAVESGLTAKHVDYYKTLNKGPEVSSAIEALTADSGDEDASSVDALLGKKTKVDLLAGLSQEDIDIINGVTTEKEVEKKKKAKAKKAAKDRKNDAKAKKGLEIF
ncbi:MAG: hypothetical protein IJU23_08595 [Proteobacteria bacterium]|nr:hypothetical protein [Pseudomonadota bacterium]MBQ9818316.1 hypothetical protein [Pseudomonadota bacterium]